MMTSRWRCRHPCRQRHPLCTASWASAFFLASSGSQERCCGRYQEGQRQGFSLTLIAKGISLARQDSNRRFPTNFRSAAAMRFEPAPNMLRIGVIAPSGRRAAGCPRQAPSYRHGIQHGDGIEARDAAKYITAGGGWRLPSTNRPPSSDTDHVPICSNIPGWKGKGASMRSPT